MIHLEITFPAFGSYLSMAKGQFTGKIGFLFSGKHWHFKQKWKHWHLFFFCWCHRAAALTDIGARILYFTRWASACLLCWIYFSRVIWHQKSRLPLRSLGCKNIIQDQFKSIFFADIYSHIRNIALIHRIRGGNAVLGVFISHLQCLNL